ncbi:hypothetical protein EV176_004662 [Coemansia sp. RSA 451]|nr:hypothetical protein EV176_004662 [Coemansia sp. RSA 451]
MKIYANLRRVDPSIALLAPASALALSLLEDIRSSVSPSGSGAQGAQGHGGNDASAPPQDQGQAQAQTSIEHTQEQAPDEHSQAPVENSQSQEAQTTDSGPRRRTRPDRDYFPHANLIASKS